MVKRIESLVDEVLPGDGEADPASGPGGILRRSGYGGDAAAGLAGDLEQDPLGGGPPARAVVHVDALAVGGLDDAGEGKAGGPIRDSHPEEAILAGTRELRAKAMIGQVPESVDHC